MKYIHKRIPAYTKREVPERALDLAKRRVAYLEALTMRSTLEDLLISAYLQGIEDCAQVMEKKVDDTKTAQDC